MPWRHAWHQHQGFGGFPLEVGLQRLRPLRNQPLDGRSVSEKKNWDPKHWECMTKYQGTFHISYSYIMLSSIHYMYHKYHTYQMYGVYYTYMYIYIYIYAKADFYRWGCYHQKYWSVHRFHIYFESHSVRNFQRIYSNRLLASHENETSKPKQDSVRRKRWKKYNPRQARNRSSYKIH